MRPATTAHSRRSPRNLGKMRPAADLPYPVAGAPHPLQPASHGAGGLHEQDLVHRAHVDPQLQRAGGDDPAQRPSLEGILHLGTPGVGDAAVVGLDQLLPGQLVEAPAEPLAQAPAVDEDDGGAVGADGLQQGRVDGRPEAALRRWRGGLPAVELRQDGPALLGPGPGLGWGLRALRGVRHVRDRHHHPQVEPGRGGGIDDLHRAVAADEAGRLIQRSDGGGQSDALRVPQANRRQALQGQGEVSAALGRCQGVDLVEDDGIDAGQIPGGLGAQEQEQGLGGRDQNLGGFPELALALPLGGVAGADRDPRQASDTAQCPRGTADPGQRGAQVALDVVNQCLERGDIEDAGSGPFPGVPGGLGVGLHQPIDGPEEGRQSLAAPRGGGDEGVVAGGDHRPAEGLGLGGGREVLLEPAAGGGCEGIHGTGAWDAGAVRSTQGRGPGAGRGESAGKRPAWRGLGAWPQAWQVCMIAAGELPAQTTAS